MKNIRYTRVKKLNVKSCQVEAVDPKDYPDFCDAYIGYAEWEDGVELTDDELDALTDSQEGQEIIQELAFESLL